MQDLLLIALTLLAFGLLASLIKGTERLRQGANDE